MTLQQLRERLRLLVPGAVKSAAPDTFVNALLNEGVNEVNYVAKVFKGSTTINAVLEQQTYTLSSLIDDYQGIEDSGVWYLDGSQWIRLIPKTKKWLDKRIENWRDEGSGVPQYYYVDADDLVLYPKPADSVTDGIRVYHYKFAEDMTNDNNYPWNNTTTEIKTFRPLDQAIVAYAQWKIGFTLAKKSDGVLDESGYNRVLLLAIRRVRRRRDITTDHDFGMKI